MKERRKHLILVGCILAALVGVAFLAVPGSPVHRKPTLGLDLQGGLEVVLKAVPPKGHKLTSDDLSRSIDIMRKRIDKLGVSEPEIRKQGSNQIVIQLAGIHDPAAAAKVIGKTAVLEFYDFEADLTGPSVSGLAQVPIAKGSLYDLLIAPETQALADKGVSQWYLFDSKHIVRAGPAPTKAVLLQSQVVQKPTAAGGLGKHIPKDWKILRVPANTVVVSCDVASGNCLSSQQLTTPRGFYLLKHSDNPNNPIPEMTGRELKLSGTRADIDTQTNQPVVLMQFTNKGKKIFHTITRREAERGALVCQGQRDSNAVTQCSQHFAIVLDREIQSVPYIDFVRNPDGIPGDNGAQIDMGRGGGLGEAKKLALVLQTGALPVKFETAERTDVSATLGKDSLTEAKKAALVGLLVVALFLLLFYRFLGLVAVIGLGIYSAFLYAAILLFHVTLTLPGFAGLILTIGVAADANVVIFERIKEEVRAGKSVRAAISAGYSKGFHTILDANVVTAITALVLFAVATAQVKGFALMLLIGTVISLITAVGATRAMLGLLAGFAWFNKPRFMGAQGQQTAKWLQIDFMRRRYLWFAISGAILVIGFGALAVRGLNLGIDFKGGSQLTFKTPVAHTTGDVRAVMSTAGLRGRRHPGARDGGERRSVQDLPGPHEGAERGQADAGLPRPRGQATDEGPGGDDRLVELRPADREVGDHRGPLLALLSRSLHRDPVRPEVRGAGDHRDAPRRPDLYRDLCAAGTRGHELDGRGDPDRARLLDLRHHHHLRPRQGEHPADAAGLDGDDHERLAVGDDPPVAGHVVHHASAGRCAVPLRRRHAQGLRVRADGRYRIGRLLVDLHRGAAPLYPQGAGARVRTPQGRDSDEARSRGSDGGVRGGACAGACSGARTGCDGRRPCSVGCGREARAAPAAPACAPPWTSPLSGSRSLSSARSR